MKLGDKTNVTLTIGTLVAVILGAITATQKFDAYLANLQANNDNISQLWDHMHRLEQKP